MCRHLFFIPNRQNQAAWPAKGFTLIELLLGIIIAAIIGLCVYNVFWSGIKLDERLRWSHENYMEMLIADQALGRDLENAVDIDVTASYPDKLVFEGRQHTLAFLTPTPKGLKRVTYSGGLVDFGKATKVLIGKRLDRAVGGTFNSDSSPVEFLLRQEQDMAAWLNGAAPPAAQIVASGIKKGSFTCRYAAPAKDIADRGSKAVEYKNEWTDAGLPMAVKCGFSVYDPKRPDADIFFERDIFLPPVQSNAT